LFRKIKAQFLSNHFFFNTSNAIANKAFATATDLNPGSSIQISWGHFFPQISPNLVTLERQCIQIISLLAATLIAM
jgi:hypothetical protein